jgi:serine/threonine-protein kinase HipA
MKQIMIYADWKGLASVQRMGVLRVEQTRGEEVFSFEYDKNWLNSAYIQELDPDLKLYSGPQHLQDDKPNFGLFLDSSPDRWGRMLMQRREVLLARNEKRSVKTLFESDYLLGVHDESRMGALRFTLKEGGPFLDDHKEFRIPPISSIRELEQASLQMEEDDFFNQDLSFHWLQLLIAPGSSLGGARPKANVMDAKGQMWIAKFPSKNDHRDSGAWEYLTHQLARKCGIRMAESMAEKYAGNQHCFLTKRFDRSGIERIHFASAMTLLGYKDGHNQKEGASYLELVELIERYGCDPTRDIRELWKRIVFFVAVHNTDDHLRNHGFILQKNGWKLSPAYDINPEPFGHGLSLNISESDNSLEFDLCMDVCEYFRWKKAEATKEIERIIQNVITWEKIAKEMNLPGTEIEIMRNAFISK